MMFISCIKTNDGAAELVMDQIGLNRQMNPKVNARQLEKVATLGRGL